MKVFILLFLGFLSAHSSDWKLGHTFPESNVKSYYEVDSNKCYFFTGRPLGPALYKSTNQGKTWELLYTYEFWDDGIPLLINADLISVKDTNVIYLTFNDDIATIKKSTDAGKTFQKVTIKDSNSKIQIFQMYNNILGIAKTSNETYLTKNGWKTKEKLTDSAFINMQKQSFFLDSNNFIFISDYGKGLSYLNKYNISKNEISLLYQFTKENRITVYDKIEYVSDSLFFISSMRGLNIFDQRADVIYRSKGSLSNWVKILDQENVPKFGFDDIAFYDELNGIAIAAGGKIYMTNDGGDNWVMERPTEIFVGEDSLYGPDANKAFWVGRTPMFGSFGGNVYRYEGNFFHFDQTKQLEKPTIASGNCNLKNVPNQIKLTWEKLSGAKLYNLELSELSDFSSTYQSYKDIDSATNLQTGLESGKKYYWRVRGLNQNQTSPWSDICSFTTKLSNITGVLPKCGDTININEITLNWQKVQNAEKYVIEQSYTNNFNNTLRLDTVSATNLALTNLKMDTTFFWRVKAINTVSESDWSATCNFSTKTLSSIANELETNFKIYPNPVKDKLTLQFTTEQTTNQLFEILDMTGKVIQSGGIVVDAKQTMLDVNQLTKGTYFLIINNQKIKFIKE